MPVLHRRLDPQHRCQVAYTPDLETDTMVTPAEAVQFLNSNMLNGKGKNLETKDESLTSEIKTLKTAKQ